MGLRPEIKIYIFFQLFHKLWNNLFYSLSVISLIFSFSFKVAIFLAFSGVTIFLPVSFSISLRVFPAIVPPFMAIILLSVNVLGFCSLIFRLLWLRQAYL